jgi:hypothetical protein
MHAGTPGWVISLRTVPSLLMCVAVGLAYKAYFYPMSPEKKRELEAMRDPDGRKQKGIWDREKLRRESTAEVTTEKEPRVSGQQQPVKHKGRWQGLWYNRDQLSGGTQKRAPSQEKGVTIVEHR